MRPLLTFIFFALILNTSAQMNFADNGIPATTDPAPASGTLSGKITTTDNQPAAYVTVSLKGTGKATTTDADGFFLMRNLKEGNYVLAVSTVGLKSLEKEVTVSVNQNTRLSFTLQEDAKQLEAVYVIAGKSLNDRPVAIGKSPINPMDLPQSIAVIG